MNQCDGCLRGLPLDTNGMHRTLVTGYTVMGCTKERYVMCTCGHSSSDHNDAHQCSWCACKSYEPKEPS